MGLRSLSGLKEYKSRLFEVIDIFGSIFAVMIQVNNKDCSISSRLHIYRFTFLYK